MLDIPLNSSSLTSQNFASDISEISFVLPSNEVAIFLIVIVFESVFISAFSILQDAFETLYGPMYVFPFLFPH